MFNTSLGIEYTYTDYNAITIGGISGPQLNVTDQTTMAKLRFRFGESYSK
jgi:opacity protein-like surface antigen